MEEGLLFGGFSPPNRKLIPLRPPSLCGEISILDKSETWLGEQSYGDKSTV
jgi:hypothetical protein